MTLSVGERVGPYEVLGLEGRGGVAEVYRAWDTRLGRTVALKVLHQDRTVDARAVAGLTREAQVLACISHPNIAEVHAFEEHGGTPVLVLEFVEGPTLADRLAAGRLDTDEALGIGGQIASALEAAHRHGVVHRDLKPSNVKLGRDGTVKVLDFGLANLTDPPTTAGDRDSSTVSGALDGITGTVAFMSPERLRGERGDERADIWGFGCTLYEMLTGRAAFRRATAAHTVAAVLTEAPDWSRLPDSLSPVVRTFLMRTLRAHPDERVRNAGDVKLALEGALDPRSHGRGAWATGDSSAGQLGLPVASDRGGADRDRRRARSELDRHQHRVQSTDGLHGNRLERSDEDDEGQAAAVGRQRRVGVHGGPVEDAALGRADVESDGGSSSLAGEPRLIARHVVPGETGRFAPFTALGRTLVFRPATPARTRLVWNDRRGVPLAPVGPVPADYGYPSLSPDATRVAVSRAEENTGRLDVWLMDAARPSGERLTQDPVGAMHPTWTPDGRRVVYASAAEGSWNLHAISPTRPDQIDVLYRSRDPIVKYPDDVTSDGRYLLYHGGGHLMRLPLGGEGPPVALIPAGFDGSVSPDGRWLAYTSRSAENLQIYVTTFPDPTERWRISTTYGRDAQWRADGRELYYIGEQGTLIAVPVRRSASFEPGHPTPLFRSDWTQRGRTQGRSYAPALDGSRFLVVEDLRGHDITLQVTINWVGHAPPAAGGPQR